MATSLEEWKKKKSSKTNAVAASDKTIAASLDSTHSVLSFRENCLAASRQQSVSRDSSSATISSDTDGIATMELSSVSLSLSLVAEERPSDFGHSLLMSLL